MPWKVFYSYSHKDELLRDQLATCLAPLRHSKQIVEWHDRKIQTGTNWDEDIAEKLDAADLVLALVSPDFLASDYCFGVEMEVIFKRLKLGTIRLVPILLRPCMWQESRFSALQMVPRDGKALTIWPSTDDALLAVSNEIKKTISVEKPKAHSANAPDSLEPVFELSLNLVRRQISTYARIYEKIRQRNRASNERTALMEKVFQSMRSLATASYPMLKELMESPSPGDRLAAVSILQVFADQSCFPFLVDIIGSEKPFIGYHAVKALRFAVGAIDSTAYPLLFAEITRAKQMLESATVGFDADRQIELSAAESDLKQVMDLNSISVRSYD